MRRTERPSEKDAMAENTPPNSVKTEVQSPEEMVKKALYWIASLSDPVRERGQ